MTIPRANATGWGANQKLTSVQANNLDIHVTWALDKRSGQTDTCASNVVVSGIWQFVGDVTAGNVTVNGALIANGSSTFNAGATVAAGGLTVTAGGVAVTAGGLTVTAGGLSVVAGGVAITAGGFSVAAGNSFFNGAGAVTFNSGVTVNGALSSASAWGLSGAVSCGNLKLSGSSVVGYTGTRTFVRVLSSISRDNSWNVGASGQFSTNASPATAGAFLSYAVDDIPHGATWTSAFVRINPMNGHAGVVGFAPQITAWKIDDSSGVATPLAVVNDPTASVLVSYETAHTIALGSIATVIDRTAFRYVLTVATEGSTNALNGCVVQSASIGFTATTMDQF